MNKSNSHRPRASTRLASGGLKLLSAGAIAIATVGCTGGLQLRPPTPPSFEAQAELGGSASAQAEASPITDTSTYEAPPAEASPSPGQFPQSGGGSFETAEITTPGSTIAGRVAKGAPRFYAIDLAVGDAISMKMYERVLNDKNSYVQVRLIEPDMVDLEEDEKFLHGGPEKLHRRNLQATAEQAGRHFIKIKSSEAPVEYRIEITSVNRAAR